MKKQEVSGTGTTPENIDQYEYFSSNEQISDNEHYNEMLIFMLDALDELADYNPTIH